MTTEFGLASGQILSNRYELGELLGKGGMGQVFLARDLETGDRVALKSLHAVGDSVDRKRFEREIRALQKLRHPNIVALRSLGWQDEQLFYTMDYHPCVSLEDVVVARGAVTHSDELDWYLRILLQISHALAYLHERHFVHRDVKPANILLRIPGLTEDLPAPEEWIQFDNSIAFLTDFGLVKARDLDGSLTRTALGTPQYMAPEQIEASPAVDERSDLYSLGVVIYRIVTGRLPFETLSAALSREPARPIREFNPKLPELLEETTSRLLHFEPFRRPADAREVEELLRSVFDRRVERSAGQRAIKLLQPSFCGRTAELRRLKKFLAEAGRGIGRWASIQGERGTGKSWLLHRSDLKSSALIHDKMSFFSGAFRAKSPHSAFGNLLEDVLGHIERHRGLEAAAQALGRRGRLIERLLPDHLLGRFLKMAPPIDSVPKEFVREHLIDTVVRVLTSGAELEPRVLVLEDLHYAAKLDIEILRRLLLASIQLPILVITTERSDARTRLPGLQRLVQEIQSEDRFEQIETKPFTSVEVRQMMESLFVPAHALSAEFADVVFERTDGIPLYVLHLINSLWNRGAIQLAGESWTIDPEEVRSLPIPKSTRSHFLLTLDEVPAEELRILNIAAVLGTEFSFDQLHSVSEIDDIELAALCRNLVHAGILEERKDGFRFQHAFEQEIVHSRLSPSMRSRLHRRTGSVLERLAATDPSTNAGDIGEHFYLGGDPGRAYDYLMHAGQKAENTYSPTVALGYYEKALESVPDDRRRRDLLVSIGSLQQALGNSEAARDHFDQARLLYQIDEREEGPLDEAGTAELKSFHDLLIRVGDFHGKVGEIQLALESYERASRVADRIKDTAAIAHASMRKGSALAAAERWEEAEVAFESAVQRFEDLAPSAGIVSALNGLSFAASFRGDFDRALAHARRGLEIAREIDDRVRAAGLLSTTGTILWRKGLLDEAVASFEQACDIQEELADRRGLARSLGNLGVCHVKRGDFRKGLNNQEKARELCRAIGDTKSFLAITGNIGMLQILRGAFREARETLTEYLSEFRRLGVQRFVADGLVNLGILDLECGNLEEAERLIREGIQNFDEAGYESSSRVSRVQLARVFLRKGEHAEAERLCAEFLETRTEEPDEAVADALRVTAEAQLLSGDAESAEAPALEALAMYEALSLPQQEGHACRTVGKVYREMGFYWADQTARYLERALSSFERLESRHALAVTKLEYGSFLVLMDDVETARKYLQEAAGVFEELEMQSELERTRRELQEID